MIKFKQIEVNGQYQFEAMNAAARKIMDKMGMTIVTPSSMLLVMKEAKGKIDFVK